MITAYQLTPVQVLSAVIVLYTGARTFMEELSMDLDHHHHHAADSAGRLRFGLVRRPHSPLIQTAMKRLPSASTWLSQSRNRGRGTLSGLEKGAAPFVISLLLMIVLI